VTTLRANHANSTLKLVNEHTCIQSKLVTLPLLLTGESMRPLASFHFNTAVNGQRHGLISSPPAAFCRCKTRCHGCAQRKRKRGTSGCRRLEQLSAGGSWGTKDEEWHMIRARNYSLRS
jgi:hypothetical protein